MAQTFDGIRLEGTQAGSKSTENVVQQYLNSQRKNPDRKSAKSSLRTYERRDRRGRHTQVGEAPSKFALTRTATLYTMPQSQPALSLFPLFDCGFACIGAPFRVRRFLLKRNGSSQANLNL